MFAAVLMKLPPWAQWIVLALSAILAVAMAVSWIATNIELLRMIEVLGRAAGHRAFLQSLHR